MENTQLAWSMLHTQVWVRVSVADGGRIRAPPLVLQLLHPSDAAVPSNHTPELLDVKRASLASAEAAAAEAAQAAAAVRSEATTARGERGAGLGRAGGEQDWSMSTVYSVLEHCQHEVLQEVARTAATAEAEEAPGRTEELLVVPYATLHDVLHRGKWVAQQRDASRQHARLAHRRLGQKRA